MLKSPLSTLRSSELSLPSISFCLARTCSFCSISLRTLAFSFSAFSLVFPRVSTRTWTRLQLIQEGGRQLVVLRGERGDLEVEERAVVERQPHEQGDEQRSEDDHERRALGAYEQLEVLAHHLHHRAHRFPPETMASKMWSRSALLATR